MPKFVDNEAGYEAWLREHPDGYVLNCDRRPRAAYLLLHRAACLHISVRHGSNENWTEDYVKVCSDDAADIEAWARVEAGDAKPCSVCRPPRVA